MKKNDIKIEFFNASSFKRLPIKKGKAVVERTLIGEGRREFEIRVVYADDSEIAELNEKFLGKSYPTDVLAFEIEKSPPEGEIYVGIETAARQAEEYGVSLRNELLRLAVHGTLHLLGYDDATDEERKTMHNLENKYID